MSGGFIIGGKYGKIAYVVAEKPSLSHRAIYIQNWHNKLDEIDLGRQKREKASCHNPLGSDYSKIKNVTTIDQSGCTRLIYACTNLHSNWHGSIDVSDITNQNIVMDLVGIPNHVIRSSSSGRCVVFQGMVMLLLHLSMHHSSRIWIHKWTKLATFEG